MLWRLGIFARGIFAAEERRGLDFGRRPKTSLNGLLDLLSCGVARRASRGEKTGMENRRKCSKISEKWKQLTSIALRTSAHCAGLVVRMTNFGIKGAHIGTKDVRSGQKRVDLSVAKKSFLLEDLRRFAASRCSPPSKAQGRPSLGPYSRYSKNVSRRKPLPQGLPSLGFTGVVATRTAATKGQPSPMHFSPVSADSPRCNWPAGELKWPLPDWVAWVAALICSPLFNQARPT